MVGEEDNKIRRSGGASMVRIATSPPCRKPIVEYSVWPLWGEKGLRGASMIAAATWGWEKQKLSHTPNS